MDHSKVYEEKDAAAKMKNEKKYPDEAKFPEHNEEILQGMH